MFIGEKFVGLRDENLRISHFYVLKQLSYIVSFRNNLGVFLRVCHFLWRR